MATTQDIVRRLIVQAQETGMTQLEQRLRGVAGATTSASQAAGVMATQVDRNDRAVLSAERSFKRLQATIDPVAREAKMLSDAYLTMDKALRTGAAGADQVQRLTNALLQQTTAARALREEAERSRGSLTFGQRSSQQVDQVVGVGAGKAPSARDSARIFEEQFEREQAQEIAKLTSMRNQIMQSADPAGEAIKRMNEQLAQLDRMLELNIIDAREFALAQQSINHNATLASKGIGLSTQQLTNLGYQLNDVVSGLLMGQSPFTIMTQQGGQVVQSLQGPQGITSSLKALGNLVGSMITPARVLGVTLASGALYAATAWNRVDNEMRAVDITMQGLGRNVGLTSQQFVQMAIESGRAGGQNERQAIATATAIARFGRISADNIAEINKSAKAFALTMGTDFTKAGEDLGKAFSNVSGIENLNQQLRFLSVGTLQYIRDLTAQGKGQEAIRIAVQNLQGSLVNYEQNVAKVKGAWELVVDVAVRADRAIGSFFNQIEHRNAAQKVKEIADQIDRVRQGETPAGQAPGGPVYVDRRPPTVASTSPRTVADAGQMAQAANAAKNLGDELDVARKQWDNLQVSIADNARKDVIKGWAEQLAPMLRDLPAGSQAFNDIKNSLALFNKTLGDGGRELREEVLGLRNLEPGTAAYTQKLRDLEEAQRRVENASRTGTDAQGLRIDETEKAVRSHQTEVDAINATTTAQRVAIKQRQIENAVIGEAADPRKVDADKRFAEIQMRKEETFAISEDIRTRRLERGALKDVGDAYDINNQVIAKQLEYRRRGMELGPPTVALMRQEIAASLEANKLHEIRNKLYQDFTKPGEDFERTIKAINVEMERGVIGANNLGQAMLDAQIKMEQAKGTMQGGFSAGLLTVQKDFSNVSKMVESFTTSTANNMVTAIADITDGTKSAGEGFRDLAKTTVRALEEMVIKMMIVAPIAKALQMVIGGATGGVTGGGDILTLLFGGGTTKAGPRHSGGLMGLYGATRDVDPLMFVGARRFHNGGLAAGEIPAILRQNEEVLTPENPRHQFNNGGGQITVNVEGARGNQEIMSMVSSGVQQGISSYDAMLNKGGLARKISSVRARGQR